MTEQQLVDIRNILATVPAQDLDVIKSMILEEETKNYDITWWKHDRTDEYIYIVHYDSGRIHNDCIGEKAYNRFINEDSATWIERKTKDLFPIHETLLRKDGYEQEGLRCGVH